MEANSLKQWASNWMYVYWKGSTLIGAPILLCLLLVFLQKTLFTGTCAVIGWQCPQGFGSAEAIASRVTQSMAPSEAKAQDRGELVGQIELESSSDAERLAKIIAAAAKKAK